MLDPTFGGCGEVIWDQGDRGVHLQAEEKSCALHLYAPHYGTMPGHEEEAGIAGTKVVVGSGVPDITSDTSVRRGK